MENQRQCISCSSLRQQVSSSKTHQHIAPVLNPLTWDLSLEEMKLSEIKIILKIIIA